MFESPKSASTHIIDIKKSWKRVLEKANIFDFHIHDLRHTLATALIANGASTAMVMRLLGHDTLAAAQRYMNSSVEDVRDVLNGAATTLTSKGQM